MSNDEAEKGLRELMPAAEFIRVRDKGSAEDRDIAFAVVTATADTDAELFDLLSSAADGFPGPAVLAVTGGGTVPLDAVAAFDLCLSGPSVRFGDERGVLTAAEAYREGLVNSVVTGDVFEAAAETADGLAALAPLALAACKKAVREGMRTDLESGLALEAELFSGVFATGDMKEGTSAFLEKRRPRFRGE